MDKQGLFSARRSEHARRLLSLKPIHFRQGQGGGRLCRYAKLLLIISPRECTSARHNPEIGIIESVFRLAARHRSFKVRRCECAGNLKTCWTKPPSSPVPLWKLDAASQRRAPSLRLRGHAGCRLYSGILQSRYVLLEGKTGDAWAWRARCRKRDNRMPAVYLGRWKER
jgi:hypothetical protein